MIALAVIAILDFFEWYFGNATILGSSIFPTSVDFSGTMIPYPVEVGTASLILFILVVELIQLAIFRARNKYELYEDGST